MMNNTKDAATQEMVNHPRHYDKGNPAYEPYKVIGEWGCNFNIGNAIKYLARYKNKWNPIEDLEKAKVYIDFEIESLKSKEDKLVQDCEKEAKTPMNTHEDENNTLEHEPCEESQSDEISCGEKIIDDANRALDSGMSRYDVMRNILKMSDDEIAETARLCGKENAFVEVANSIAKKISDGLSNRRRHFHF